MSTKILLLKLEEPVSPPSDIDDITWPSDPNSELLWDDRDLLKANICTIETKVEFESNILEGFEKIEDLDQWIQNEDSFANCWLEEKMLPLFEEPMVAPALTQGIKNSGIYDTQSLLKEFETVFDAVNIIGALTPPQSPPHQQLPILTNLEPIVHTNHIYSNVSSEEKGLINIAYIPSTPQTDVVQELAVVDELVRKRVEFMVPKSPSSQGSSSYSDCSSDGMEWIPETVDSDHKVQKSSRSKPYSRSPDKKNRKKEQNKNAATRYRLKKKAEVDEILGEEKVLFDANTDLENKVEDLSREIKYIKGLMRELFKAKGVIK